ncbi:unnamed protein product, partial [Sphenostylis stenocarpa]
MFEDIEMERRDIPDLLLVPPELYGEGYPYAPENWPGRGSAPCSTKTRKKYIFASKVAVKNYIRTFSPATDPEAVLSTFYWKIPALPPASAYRLRCL